eukprot:861969-Pyramimonas_sp.AAC.1
MFCRGGACSSLLLFSRVVAPAPPAPLLEVPASFQYKAVASSVFLAAEIVTLILLYMAAVSAPPLPPWGYHPWD